MASISSDFRQFQVSLGVYLICPCRDAPPLYYPESTCSGSLPQKVKKRENIFEIIQVVMKTCLAKNLKISLNSEEEKITIKKYFVGF